MSRAPEIGWKDILSLLSPGGQRQLVEFVRRAKEERGANWLPEIKYEFPTFSWIADLVANKTAEEAFAELAEEFPTYPLWMMKGKLTELHGALRAEIERKR